MGTTVISRNGKQSIRTNRRRAAASRVREAAARSCIDTLESRLLLSTTTISYPSGFSSAFDISTVGDASITTSPPAGELQLIQGNSVGGENGAAWDLNPQGISTFDTTFKFDLGSIPPDADGFTFTIQNDPGTYQALGASGGNMGYGGIKNSVAVKFDFYDSNPANAIGGPVTGNTTYNATGVYTDGATPSDDPRQGVTTTPAPIGTSVDLKENAGTPPTPTGLDFHANPTDQYQCHLVYDGTTLTETVTDLTSMATATQTYTINIPSIVGQSTANVGFTAGDGGAFSMPQISSWVYTGTGSTAPIPLAAPVLSGAPGLTGTASLSWTESTALTVAGYEVDAINGTTATPIATVAGNVTTYTATGLNPTQSYTFAVKALGDGTTDSNSPLSNTVSVSAAGVGPTLSANPVLPGQISVNWTTSFTPPNGLELDASTDGGATFSKLATFAPATGSYTFTNLDVTKTYQLKLKALGNGTTTQDSPYSNTATATGAGASVGPVTFTSFPNSVGLVLNGVATVTGANGTPPNALELTHAANNEVASAFATSLVGVDTFDTTFQWTYGTQHAPNADGFTFTLASSPRAIGGGGGSLGYAGIPNSIAVMFNIYNASQTGIAVDGAAPKANPIDVTTNPDQTPTGVDFHAHPGDTFQAHLSYDGTTLTETVTDQTQIAAGNPATFTTSYPVDVPTAIGGDTAFVGFTAATGGANSQQDILGLTYTGTGNITLPLPTVVATSGAPGAVDVGWTDTITSAGFEVDQSTDGSTFTPVATNLPPSADFYHVTGLTPGGLYYFRVKSTGVGDAPSQTSAAVPVTVATTTPPPVNYGSGFSYDGNLQFNSQVASINGNNALQLSLNGVSATTTVFTVSPQNVSGFDTTFTFTYVPGTTAPGDGFAFVIQNSPAGASAVGGAGGGLGYGPTDYNLGNAGGITNSIAVKFDLYSNNGEGTDSTGLFINGNAPTLPVRTDTGNASLDMTASGVQLATTDTYSAHLTYDGATLHEVVTDVTTGKSFSHDYAINLTQIIKGNFAYVGFTAGSGGAQIEQDINTWTFTSVPVQPSQDSIVGTSGNDAITLKQDTDHQHIDWTLGAQSGKLLIADANGLTINGNGGSDTITLDPSNGNPLPNKLVLNSTGSFTLSGFSTLGTGQTIDISKGTTLNLPTGGSVTLASVQGLLKSGSIKSTDAANSGGKLAVADTLSGSNVTLKDALIGDVNQDGTVAFADLLALAQHYGQTGADWSKGDLNYDGTVGFADLLALAQHYGQSTAAVATPAAAAAASPMLAASSNDLLVKKSRKNA